MKKGVGDAICKVVDVIETSSKFWEDAAVHAVETAAASPGDLRIAEVVMMDLRVEIGRVSAFRTRVAGRIMDTQMDTVLVKGPSSPSFPSFVSR